MRLYQAESANPLDRKCSFYGLPLALILLWLCAFPGSLRAQEQDEGTSSEASLRVYADDDHVTVISPSVSTRQGLADGLALSVATTVDVVSAASVDVVSSASPTEVRETRVEGSLGLTWAARPTLKFRGGGTASYESDYTALRPGIGATLELAERNTTVDVSYTAAVDQVGHALDSEFSESRRGHMAVASLTQIIDASTYLDLIADLRHFRGYHSNPYRRVEIRSELSPELDFVDEKTPTIRQSGAAMFRVRRALGQEATWFLHASYRFYGDSWDIKSHTLSAKLMHSLDEGRYLLGWKVRGYQQGAADFYQAYYELEGEEVPRYRSKDRTLGGMRSLHSSVTADAALSQASSSEAWRLRTTLATTLFLFSDYPAQKERRAITLGVTLHAPL